MPHIKLSFAHGKVHTIFDDRYTRGLIARLGAQDVKASRASHVELAPDAKDWSADLSPVEGPVLSGFATHAEAVNAEVRYLNQNVISNPKFIK